MGKRKRAGRARDEPARPPPSSKNEQSRLDVPALQPMPGRRPISYAISDDDSEEEYAPPPPVPVASFQDIGAAAAMPSGLATGSTVGGPELQAQEQEPPKPVAGQRPPKHEEIESHASKAKEDVRIEEDDDKKGEEEDAQIPEGPYSYTVEKRQELAAKRSYTSYNPSKAQPRTDLEFGQMCAFPDIEPGSNEDEMGDGEDVDDGMGYLRMVRSEARGLKRVVRADHITTEEDNTILPEKDDNAGYYSDGAYIGRPDPSTTGYYGVPRRRVQNHYHFALCERFQAHTEALHAQPSAHAIAALDEQLHPITSPARNPLAAREWRDHFRDLDPLPAQLASMDTGTVVRLLEITEGLLEQCVNAGRNVSMRLSAWIWGLLGRLDEVGMLQTSEVGGVRDLAKTAVWVGYGFRKRKGAGVGDVQFEVETGDQGEEDEEMNKEAEVPEVGNGETEEATLDATEGRLLDRVDDSSEEDHSPEEEENYGQGVMATLNMALKDQNRRPLDNDPFKLATKKDLDAVNQDEDIPDFNTLATLDLIITVAGEFYGQRDLLDSRMQWEIVD